MSLNGYESELYPLGHEPQDFDWQKAMLFSLPTDDLKREYEKLFLRLQELRDNEPPKKRSKKAAYRAWVSQTHDLLDLLNAITKELGSR